MKKFNILIVSIIALFVFASCEVPEEPNYAISIECKDTTIEVGESLSYSVIAHCDGDDAPEYSILCPQADILEYDEETGTITGKAPGKAYIFAKLRRPFLASDPVSIKVVPKTVYAESLEIKGPEGWDGKIHKNKTVQLTAVTVPENTVDTVTWKSSDDGIVSCTRGGKIKGISEGSVVITAETDKGVKAEFNVESLPEVPARYIDVLTLDSELVVPAGGSIELRARILPAEADQHFEITPAYEDQCTIEGNKVTPNCNTYVYLVSGGLSRTVNVYVADWRIAPPDVAYVGDNYYVSANNANSIEVYADFFVSDTSIADFEDDGNLHVYKEGTVVVTAQYSNGVKLEKTVTCSKRPAVTSFVFDTSDDFIDINDQKDIVLKVEPAGAAIDGFTLGGTLKDYAKIIRDGSDIRVYIDLFHEGDFVRENPTETISVSCNGETQTKTLTMVDAKVGDSSIVDNAKKALKNKNCDTFLVAGRLSTNGPDVYMSDFYVFKEYLAGEKAVLDLRYITNDMGFGWPFGTSFKVILPSSLKDLVDFPDPNTVVEYV